MKPSGSEILDLSASPAPLIAAAAVILVLFSGIAANALFFGEDLHHRWVGCRSLRHGRGAHYRVNMGAELRSGR